MEAIGGSSEMLGRLLRDDPTQSDLEDYGNRLAAVWTDVLVARGHIPDPLRRRPQLLRDVKDGFFRDMQDTELRGYTLRCLIPLCYPEFVFPLGFDEVRYGGHPIDDHSVSESAKGVLAEQKEFSPIFRDLFQNATHYRSPDGVWHDWEGVIDRAFPPQTKPGHGEERPESEWWDLLESHWLSRMSQAQPHVQNVVALPGLWLPPSYGDSNLHRATKDIIRNVALQTSTFADLHWRTLEELVAELLHDLGMQVTITDRSGDGGRDVIAKGELIPGEPTLLAVEVKHRKVVPVSELRNAMWANRHFPALLFVTSGSLSAGVYRMRSEQEGALRLFLKDGYGLSQWISQYARRNFDSP
jgi:hypothetical protein